MKKISGGNKWRKAVAKKSIRHHGSSGNNGESVTACQYRHEKAYGKISKSNMKKQHGAVAWQHQQA